MEIINSEILQTIFSTEKRESQGLLPELIKRLIIHSVSKVSSIRIPGKDDIWAPGFDGIVEIGEETKHLHKGVCVWEFGSCSDSLSKIESDYIKRTNDSLGIEKENADFYLVMPKIWAFQRKSRTDWENQHKENWHSVKIIDAPMLCDWINATPEECCWLIENYFHLKLIDFKSIEKAFQHFSNKTNPSMGVDLFIKSREEEMKKLYASSGQAIVRIKGESFADAYGFALAAFLQDANYKNSVVVVDNIDTFRSIDRVVSNKIFLFSFPCDEDINTENNNSVILCFNNRAISVKHDILLERQGVSVFESALVQMSISEHEAGRLCSITNRSVISLIYQIPGNSNLSRPEWSNDADLSQLIPLLFLGRVDRESAYEKALIEKISEDKYKEFDKAAKRILQYEGTPIKSVDRFYSIVNLEDLWCVLRLNANDDWFDKLISTIESEIESKCAESAHILVRLFDALSYFAEFDSNNKHKIDCAVENILDELTKNERWNVLFEQLNSLAKAAPKKVIGYIEQEMSTKGSVLLDSFAQKDFRRDYCKVLWTLDTLMRFEESKIQACNTLFYLYLQNYTYILSNTPEDSLLNELCLWNTRSNFTIEEKMSIVLSQMQCGSLAMGNFAMNLISMHTCSYAMRRTDKEREIKEFTGEQYRTALVDIANKIIDIIIATKSAELLSKFIANYQVIRPDLFTNLADRIIYEEFDKEGLSLVYHATLKQIVQITKYVDRCADYIPHLKYLAEKISGSGLLSKSSAYFRDFYACPIVIDGEDADFSGKAKQIMDFRIDLYSQLRQECGKEIYKEILAYMNDEPTWGAFWGQTLEKADAVAFTKKCVELSKYKLMGSVADKLDREVLIDALAILSEKEQCELFRQMHRLDVEDLLSTEKLEQAFWCNKSMGEYSENVYNKLLRYNPCGLIDYYYRNGVNSNNLEDALHMLEEITKNGKEQFYANRYEYEVDVILTKIDASYYSERIALVELNLYHQGIIEVAKEGCCKYLFENPLKLCELLNDDEYYNYCRYSIFGAISLRNWAFEQHERFMSFCDVIISNVTNKNRAFHFLGEILSTCPVGEDGVYPHEYVREEIEKLASDDFDLEFFCGKINAGGCRCVHDGKDQEEIAQRLEGEAYAIQIKYPRTASILRRFANFHRNNAKSDKIHAEIGWI